MSVFVGAILAASMTASATSSEPAGNAKSSLNTSNKQIPTQINSISSAAEIQATPSQPTNKSEPIMPTEWLLTMALFGFVMLSNRSGV